MRKMYLLIATRGREYMQVPKFKRYDPSQDDMDRHQLSFYKLVGRCCMKAVLGS